MLSKQVFGGGGDHSQAYPALLRITAPTPGTIESKRGAGEHRLCVEDPEQFQSDFAPSLMTRRVEGWSDEASYSSERGGPFRAYLSRLIFFRTIEDTNCATWNETIGILKFARVLPNFLDTRVQNIQIATDMLQRVVPGIKFK